MSSGFKGYHPLVNVLFFISIIAFGMLLRHPVYLVISFISSTAYYLKLSGKDGRKTVFRFLLPMLLFVVIINSFFNHYGVTTLFILPSGNNFTFEALVMGIVSGITVVSVIQWFFCCNEVVTEDKFMHIFGRILPKGALVVSMILRFVPLYRRRYKEISQARKSMGLNGTDSFICKMKNTFKNIGILVSWSFENAIETADSMKARGYGQQFGLLHLQSLCDNKSTVRNRHDLHHKRTEFDNKSFRFSINNITHCFHFTLLFTANN